MDGALIVVGLDGSPAAANALRWAARRADDTTASLRVVHAYARPRQLSVPGRALRTARETDARVRATMWVRGSLGEGPHTTRILLTVAEGPPWRVLVSMSQHAVLLVLGAPAGNRQHRRLSGSVARHCAAGVGCPVVLVPSDRPA